LPVEVALQFLLPLTFQFLLLVIFLFLQGLLEFLSGLE